MYYRIDWCISRNALGGTRSHEEPNLQSVILWLVREVEALEKRSAGFSVYRCRDDERPDALPVTLYNWQAQIYNPGEFDNFGHLHVDGFPYEIIMSNGHSVVRHSRRGVIGNPAPVTLDSFAACFAPSDNLRKEV